MRTLIPALLLLLASVARADGDLSGEYRVRSSSVATFGGSKDIELTLSRRADGRYDVTRREPILRFTGTGVVTGQRLQVTFPPGLSALLDGRSATATYVIDPEARTLRGLVQVRHGRRTAPWIERGRQRSLYRLPWPANVTRLCVQGNGGWLSHESDGWDEHSFDFAMPVGSDVLAARAGVVTHVDVSHHGQGKNKPANVIYIRHDDGTVASYVHLKKGGSFVRAGQRVEQGQRIGLSGNVGPSLLPHLHFMVERDRRSIEVWFDDVAQNDGVPRTFGSYTSSNRAR
jgi:murein DD-endopeptidase MepM/ murein hydrolase activator NlpD